MAIKYFTIKIIDYEAFVSLTCLSFNISYYMLVAGTRYHHIRANNDTVKIRTEISFLTFPAIKEDVYRLYNFL